MSHTLTLLIIAVGGAVGAMSRYQVTIWCHQWFGDNFPYATLLVNVIGCFSIGLLISALNHQILVSAYWRPIISVGFLGGLTTFSTFSIDTLLLFNQGEWLKAALNVLLNLMLCMTAVAVGYQLVDRGQG